jgi:hypothetical protein
MVLQLTAWTGMVVARSQHAPVVQAVETTFDGQHPCRLCNAIEAGKQEDQKQEREVPTLKKLQEAKFLAEVRIEAPLRVSAEECSWPGSHESPGVCAQVPPTPPPRA